ncbi:uncharacterized protein LOC117647100 [Thrips palmi]|uniref:Uncharacterized protein LOC117647100 n=1 Tax=Thrips palmi TaxID=161013 RepID=A0A6P8Z3A3_THRPL|nr:uncharacterized protein LOC117647100 [Thrips palmi]XP_034244524.1 uncharacterized protein LOC117647100 [Thrips palmi]
MDGSESRAMSPLKTHDDELHEKKSDVSEESTLKPLKKAHYVWQIKGNYHLKNSNHSSQARESSFSGASSSSLQEVINGGSETDVNEPTMEVERVPHVCEHHSSQSGGDNPLLKSSEEFTPLSPLHMGASSVSCVVCDTFNENVKKASLHIDEDRSRTPPLPTSHPDLNVRKWQTRQIAKAFMENTINSVLEEMGFTPVPESAPDSDPDDVLGSINFPRVDTSEEEEEDESVENEGILSAIQRHGLHRHTLQSLPEAGSHFSYSSSSPSRCFSSPPRLWEPKHLIYRPTFLDESPSSPESLSVGSDFGVSAEEQTLSPADIEEDADSTSSSNCEDDADEMQYNYAPPSSCRCAFLSLSKSKEAGPSSADSNTCTRSTSPDGKESSQTERPDEIPIISKKCSSRLEESDDDVSKKRQGKSIVSSCISKRSRVEPNEYSICSSSTPSQSSHSRTSPGLNADAVAISSLPNEENPPTFGHFDFMDAAVAAAIQKKGLSALTCQDL